uniref:hypothetical protein n=1 Tax=Acinetobacter baumannii TaxID=470 RepID=UPI001C06FBB0
KIYNLLDGVRRKRDGSSSVESVVDHTTRKQQSLMLFEDLELIITDPAPQNNRHKKQKSPPGL